jgi:hypothetical protein
MKKQWCLDYALPYPEHRIEEAQHVQAEFRDLIHGLSESFRHQDVTAR